MSKKTELHLLFLGNKRYENQRNVPETLNRPKFAILYTLRLSQFQYTD